MHEEAEAARLQRLLAEPRTLLEHPVACEEAERAAVVLLGEADDEVGELRDVGPVLRLGFGQEGGQKNRALPDVVEGARRDADPQPLAVDSVETKARGDVVEASANAERRRAEDDAGALREEVLRQKLAHVDGGGAGLAQRGVPEGVLHPVDVGVVVGGEDVVRRVAEFDKRHARPR